MSERECPICGASTNQPICGKCWKGYLDDLQKLSRLLPELELVARREEHIGGRQQGHASPAFASTPVELGAMDLLQEASDTLEDVAGNCNIWAGTWRSIVRKMVARRTQVTQSKEIASDRERISRLVGKVALRLTPPTERLIIGTCLNPECKTELHAVRGQEDVVCPRCGSAWKVQAVREARRERLGSQILQATPAEASAWLRRETGVFVTRKVINMWAQRGMLNAPSLGDGVHDFNVGELLTLAETMRNPPRIRRSL